MNAREFFATHLFESEKRSLIVSRDSFDALPSPEKEVYLAETDYYFKQPQSDWPEKLLANKKFRTWARRRDEGNICGCGQLIVNEARYCISCGLKNRKFDVEKFQLPSLVEVKKLITEHGKEKTSALLGLSFDKFVGWLRHRKQNKACVCGKAIIDKAKSCNSCGNKLRKYAEKFNWPADDVVRKIIAQYGLRGAARHIGVAKTSMIRKLQRMNKT